MAFTTLARKSASSLAPLAKQILRGQKTHNYHSHSSVFASLSNAGRGGPTGLARRQPCLCPVCCSRLRLYSKTSSSDGNVLKVIESSSSGENLLKVIESEIGYAQETDDHDKVEQAPSGFPFQIQDHPGQQTITLTRDYQGEEITIEVHMPDLVTGEDDEDDDDDCDEEKANQSSIPLVVNVSKKNGPVLEFGCTAYPDEINIDSLSIKNPEASEDQIAYEGPDFHDLDENLQKAFYKYLEIRGIKPSTTNFLHEYMINKDSREYLMWLKNVKNFIEA